MFVFGIRGITVGIIFIFIMVMFYSPIAKAQEDSERTFDAYFPAQELPDSDVTIQNNIANQSEVRTEIDVWENDLGRQITDGSYVGGIFESSLFEIDYDPLDENDSFTYAYDVSGLEYDANIVIPKQRSIIALSSEVRFENRVIMSGATEFYVKIPIHPSCLNLEEMNPVIYMFNIGQDNFDNDKLHFRGSHRITQILYNNISEFTTNGEEYFTSTRLGQPIPLNDTWGFRLFYDGGESDIKCKVNIHRDNTLYARVFGTIEPNTNYVISIVGELKTKPLVYLTEEDICSNGRSGYYTACDLEYTYIEGKWIDKIPLQQDLIDQYFPNIDQLGLAKEHVLTWSEYVPTPTATPPNPPFAPAGLDIISSFLNKTEEIPVDLGWSFIFKTGRGAFGMFGKKFHFEKHDSIVFYKELEKTNNAKYISIMLPLISEQQVAVNLTVVLLEQQSLRQNMFESELIFRQEANDTGYIKRHWWNSEEIMKYTDYILFTVPLRLDHETLSGKFHVKVIVTFTEDVDVTLMFSTLENDDLNTYTTDHYHQDFDKSSVLYEYPITYPPQWIDVGIRDRLTYIYKNTKQVPYRMFSYEQEYPVNIRNMDYSMDRQLLEREPDIILQYELFNSIQLTDGIWAEIVTTSEGFQYATHFFKRRIAVGIIDLWVDTTNNESNYQERWYENEDLSTAWDLLKKGDILGAIFYGLKGIIGVLWNGLKAFLGVVIGVFSKVWDGLVGLGKFVYSILTGFIDKIVSIIGDLVQGIEDILEVVIYAIAILIFMIFVSGFGKLLYLNRKVSLSEV